MNIDKSIHAILNMYLYLYTYIYIYMYIYCMVASQHEVACFPLKAALLEPRMATAFCRSKISFTYLRYPYL